MLMAPTARRRAVAAALAAVAGVVAPIRADAQLQVFTNRTTFLNAATHYLELPCENDLNDVADGATSFLTRYYRPFGLPCAIVTLHGATVTNEAVTSGSPFSVTIQQLSFTPNRIFGVDFRSSTADVAYFRFGTNVVTRPIGAGGDEFLGVISFAGAINGVEIGVQNGSTFTVDNFVTSTPEPSTVALLATGLLAIGAAVRRRTRAAG